MMRNILFSALLLMSPQIFAQIDSAFLKTDSTKHSDVVNYYAAYGLHPDSAVTPSLFYDVYEWKGTKYHYGGMTKKGVDCSGFVINVYREAYHIDILNERSAKSLFIATDTVPRKELAEGDLVFFRIKKGQVSHVGIYLGNNKFVHASVHGGVMIDDLDEPYYRKYFYRGGKLKTGKDYR
ncbi:MAG: C40 family peptidase [Bacteroidetes bacterium]|nr:C40 family peptidase [Bacteroidota bacterium]